MTKKQKKSITDSILKNHSNEIIARIEKIMVRDSLNQRKLAKIIGCNEGYISYFFTQKGTAINLRTIAKFEAALGEQLIIIPKKLKRK